MEEQDKRFGVALQVVLAVSGAIAYFSVPVVDHIAFARLENPATR